MRSMNCLSRGNMLQNTDHYMDEGHESTEMSQWERIAPKFQVALKVFVVRCAKVHVGTPCNFLPFPGTERERESKGRVRRDDWESPLFKGNFSSVERQKLYINSVA